MDVKREVVGSGDKHGGCNTVMHNSRGLSYFKQQSNLFDQIWLSSNDSQHNNLKFLLRNSYTYSTRSNHNQSK